MLRVSPGWERKGTTTGETGRGIGRGNRPRERQGDRPGGRAGVQASCYEFFPCFSSSWCESNEVYLSLALSGSCARPAGASDFVLISQRVKLWPRTRATLPGRSLPALHGWTFGLFSSTQFAFRVPLKTPCHRSAAHVGSWCPQTAPQLQGLVLSHLWKARPRLQGQRGGRLLLLS